MEGITNCYGEQHPALSAAERLEDALAIVVSAGQVGIGGVSTVLTAEAAYGTHPSVDQANDQARQSQGVLAGFQAVL